MKEAEGDQRQKWNKARRRQKKSQSRENRDLDRGRAPPTPPSGVPVAMRHPAAAAGLGGWNHGSPRWMGRGR